MRRYDDPVEVRRGMVEGPSGRHEGPEQFLWRGRLWKVCGVVAHWVETGPWWQSSGVRAVLGAEDPGSSGHSSDPADPGAEREVWRVEAAPGRGARSSDMSSGVGVFDLEFDWARGSWQLARCLD
jgi:hypothetical protein